MLDCGPINYETGAPRLVYRLRPGDLNDELIPFDGLSEEEAIALMREAVAQINDWWDKPTKLTETIWKRFNCFDAGEVCEALSSVGPEARLYFEQLIQFRRIDLLPF